MAQIIKLRRSSVAGKIPTNDQLQLGELSINTTDGKLYFAKSGSIAPSIEEIITTNTYNTGSLSISGSINLIGDGHISGALHLSNSIFFGDDDGIELGKLDIDGGFYLHANSASGSYPWLGLDYNHNTYVWVNQTNVGVGLYGFGPDSGSFLEWDFWGDGNLYIPTGKTIYDQNSFLVFADLRTGNTFNGDQNINGNLTATGYVSASQVIGNIDADKYLKLPLYSSDPVGEYTGSLYYNTNDNNVYRYDGSTWLSSIGTSGSAGSSVTSGSSGSSG